MKLFWRVFFYIFGLTLVAFGVGLAIRSGLGISPVSSLPFAVSEATGLRLGLCVTGVYCVYVLVQLALLRREFKPILLLEVVFATIYGYLVDFAKWAVSGIPTPNYLVRLLLLCTAILLFGFGLVLYLTADLVPMPMEGMLLAIEKKQSRLKYHQLKIAGDVIGVGLAALILFVGTGTLNGLREGTLLMAIFSGPVVGLVARPLAPRVAKLCFGADRVRPAPDAANAGATAGAGAKADAAPQITTD